MVLPMRFTNWSGAVHANPQRFHRPRSTEEVQQIMEGMSDGEQLRLVGAGHSFTPLAASDQTMMNLDLLSGLVCVDAATSRARFLAGTRLRDVPGLLAPHGLALPNQGDVDPQSLGGATSTGTHGTGLGFTGFAGALTGMTLITAEGRRLDLSREQQPELFDLARLSLGALGVVIELEYQCVPAFDLLADERSAPLDDVLDSFEERARKHDHVEFFWFPHTTNALVKTNTRLAPNDPTPGGDTVQPNAWQRYINEELLDNLTYNALCWLGSKVPGIIPAANRLASSTISDRRYRDSAHAVFVSPRRVKFFETEYAVPLADGPDVMREIRSLIDRRGWRISFPLEFRCAAADDVPLSTAYHRESAYIAIHRYRRDKDSGYFREVEAILREAAGRPHWGKLHSLTAHDLRARYPRFDDFLAARDQLDPGRRFSTPYLTMLLGN